MPSTQVKRSELLDYTKELEELRKFTACEVANLRETSASLQDVARCASAIPRAESQTVDQLQDGVVACKPDGTVVKSSLSAKLIDPCFMEGSNVLEPLGLKLLKVSDSSREFSRLRQDNSVSYYDYVISSIVEYGQPMFVLTFRDVTKQRVEEKSNRVRSKIYYALASEANRLLTTDDSHRNLKVNIRQLVERVMTASHAEHCVVFENNHVANRLQAKTYTKANNPELNPSVLPEQLDLAETFPQSVAPLSRGRHSVVFKQNLPQSVQHVLGKNGIHTLVFVPIYTNDYWWGELLFMYQESYDDSWFYSECDALTTCTSFIGTLLMRAEAQNVNENSLLFQQALFDVVPLPLFARNNTGEFYYANEAYENLTGLTLNQILGKDTAEVFGEKSEVSFDHGREVISVPASIKHAITGEVHTGTVLQTALYGVDGIQHGVLGVFQSEAHCKTGCADMHSAVNMLTSLLDNADDFLLFKNMRGEIVYANAKFRSITNADIADLRGKVNNALTDRLPHAFLLALTHHEFLSFTKQETVHFHTTIYDHCYRVQIKPVQNAKGLVSGYLVQGHPEVESVEAPYKSMADNLNLPVLTVKQDGTIVYANVAAMLSLGVSTEESNLLELVHPKQTQAAHAFLLGNSGQRSARFTLTVGGLMPTEWRITSDGNRVQVVVIDRTSSMRETGELRELLNATIVPAFLITESGEMRYCNQPARAKFSISGPETLTSLGFAQKDCADLTKLLRNNEKRSFPTVMVRTLPDGEVVQAHVNVQAFRAAENPLVLGLLVR